MVDDVRRLIVRALLPFMFVVASSTPVYAAEAAQPASLRLDVTATRVAYYTDLQMVGAKGNVLVKLSNGVQLRGDSAIVNLSLRRFVIAGHVTLTTASGQYHGAAFAEFLAFRRSYFIPLDGVPDRWTFLNDDYATPEKGREMPGDAFSLADLNGSAPFVVGNRVEIDPENYVQFFPSRFIFFNGTLQMPPLPTYVRNFSANQNFAVNSLSGATFDLPYGIAASPASLETLHFRYDQQKKTYGAFEHHSVYGQTGYTVFSLNPATQPAKQWNLLTYVGSSQNAISLNAQLFTYQYGLNEPLSSSAFVDVQQTRALTGSSLRIDVTQSYGSLLAPPQNGLYYHDPAHPYTPNHPIVAGIGWSGYDKALFRSGLSFRLLSGVAAIHDGRGIGSTGQKDGWLEYFGGLMYTPVYRAPLGTGAYASYQFQRTWLSFPNHVGWQTLIATDSKQLSPRWSLTLSYLLQSVSTARLQSLFASPNGATGLASQPGSPNGLPLLGGVPSVYPSVDNETWQLVSAWTPSTNFQFTAAAQANHYGPVQQPNIAGPPRYVLGGDLRTRISKTLFVDVGRSYQFNWGGHAWSPAFVLQVSAQ